MKTIKDYTIYPANVSVVTNENDVVDINFDGWNMFCENYQDVLDAVIEELKENGVDIESEKVEHIANQIELSVLR